MRIEFNEGSNTVTLCQNYMRYSSIVGDTVFIAEGFVFDGASIPKAFWSLIGSPFSGKYRQSALIHDALYASELVPRDEADKCFLELMEKDGVSWLKRYTMYNAVRVGGYFVWKNHKKETIEEARKYVRIV